MKLEELLNKLIDMGWKPWGLPHKDVQEHLWWYIFQWNMSTHSLNDLCSIDSWLWQFVDKNMLYKDEDYKYNYSSWLALITNEQRNTEYRLMLSSIQEDKEKFLLENIKL